MNAALLPGLLSIAAKGKTLAPHSAVCNGAFHTDPERQFPTIMDVKSEALPQAPYPNWTAIGFNWLAGFDFEIKVIARIPAGVGTPSN